MDRIVGTLLDCNESNFDIFDNEGDEEVDDDFDRVGAKIVFDSDDVFVVVVDDDDDVDCLNVSISIMTGITLLSWSS